MENILAGNILPDASGEVYQTAYANEDTGAVINPLVLAFDDPTGRRGIHGLFKVPGDYGSAPVLRIVWTANATSGDVVWDWTVLPRSGTEDMGAAAARDTETATATKSSTAFARQETTITLTAGDYAADDDVLFVLSRDGAGGDTMAAKAVVFAAYFDYTPA